MILVQAQVNVSSCPQKIYLPSLMDIFRLCQLIEMLYLIFHVNHQLAINPLEMSKLICLINSRLGGYRKALRLLVRPSHFRVCSISPEPFDRFS